jgi:hypothetical protein
MYTVRKSLSSVVVLTTFLLTTSAFAMDTWVTPEEIKSRIVKQAAYEQCLENNAPPTMKTLVHQIINLAPRSLS